MQGITERPPSPQLFDADSRRAARSRSGGSRREMLVASLRVGFELQALRARVAAGDECDVA